MRFLILACGLIFTVNTFARGQSNVPDKTELHDVVLSYFEMQRVLSRRHPKIVEMRMEVESRLNEGERFISRKLHAKLSDYYREHQVLTDKLSMRHPRIVANLHRLSITSRLMTYDSDYFAKNWERLATSGP